MNQFPLVCRFSFPKGRVHATALVAMAYTLLGMLVLDAAVVEK